MSALLQSSSSPGLDAESGPLWFKPEKFLEPKFNPEAYVNDLKRYVSSSYEVLRVFKCDAAP
jgi:hypothetical protein